MKSSLSDAQDRVLKSFSHSVKGSSANSAVATAIELGKQNRKAFEADDEPHFSFANPEYFGNYLETKRAAAEASKQNETKKKKKK